MHFPLVEIIIWDTKVFLNYNPRIVSARVRSQPWRSCEYKEGMSDETKNRDPLYMSVYAAKQMIRHGWTVPCSGLHTPSTNPTGLRRRVMMITARCRFSNFRTHASFYRVNILAPYFSTDRPLPLKGEARPISKPYHIIIMLPGMEGGRAKYHHGKAMFSGKT
jgi:hypothetical protein